MSEFIRFLFVLFVALHTMSMATFAESVSRVLLEDQRIGLVFDEANEDTLYDLTTAYLNILDYSGGVRCGRFEYNDIFWATIDGLNPKEVIALGTLSKNLLRQREFYDFYDQISFFESVEVGPVVRFRDMDDYYHRTFQFSEPVELYRRREVVDALRSIGNIAFYETRPVFDNAALRNAQICSDEDFLLLLGSRTINEFIDVGNIAKLIGNERKCREDIKFDALMELYAHFEIQKGVQ